MNELDVDGFFRALRAVFGALTEKERKVVLMRHGITHTFIPATLQDVGKELGVTRERVRQIEALSEEKIRSIIKDVSVLLKPTKLK